MIIFELADKELHVERDAIEAHAQGFIAAKLEESKDLSPILRSTLKSAADMILSFVGVKAPKGVDKLEYLSAYILKLGLDAIEGKPIPVDAKEVPKAIPQESKGMTDNAV